MPLTSLNPNLLGTDSTGASKLSSAGGLVQLHATGLLAIANNTANTFAVTNTGSVGIGITAPTTMLHAKAPAFTDGIVTIDSTNTNVSQRLNLAANGTIQTQLYDDSTQTILKSITAKPLYLGANNTNYVTVAANGSIGIGVTTPSFLTEIVGGSNTVETTLFQIRSNHTGTNTGTTIALGNSTNPTAGSGRVELAALRNTASGSAFVIRTADSSGTITEQMRVDTAGRVTMPNQPYFAAHVTGNGNYTSVAEAVPFPANSTAFNTGSHYNTSTFRFTAPIAGNYIFTFAALTGTSTSQSRPMFYVNGSSSLNGFQFGMSGCDTGNPTNTTSAIIKLSAGDFVDVRSQGGRLYYYGAAHSSFTGILLS